MKCFSVTIEIHFEINVCCTFYRFSYDNCSLASYRHTNITEFEKNKQSLNDTDFNKIMRFIYGVQYR